MFKFKSKKNVRIPMIVMSILVFSSFIPLIQITLLTINGAIIYPLNFIVDSNDITYIHIFIFNSLMSITGLIFFYKSHDHLRTLFTVIFTVLFLFPLMVLALDFIKTEVYFLQNLIAGFFVGLIFLIIGILKKGGNDADSEI